MAQGNHFNSEPGTQNQNRVELYHSPQSRSRGTRVLLEELGAPYEVHFLDLKKDAQRSPAFLKLNSMGKIPTVVHRGEVITEQVAITTYLADAFPTHKLAPLIGEKGRGTYLRWMAFYGSCFEPALMDKAMKYPPSSPSTLPYGNYDRTVQALLLQLEQGDYMLGNRFTALDVLWGSALQWTTQFGLIEKTPRIEKYIELTMNRPAALRAAELDLELMKQQESAPASKI